MEKRCEYKECKKTFKVVNTAKKRKYCDRHKNPNNRRRSTFEPYRKTCETEGCRKTFIINEFKKTKQFCAGCMSEKRRIYARDYERAKRARQAAEKAQKTAPSTIDSKDAPVSYEMPKFNADILNINKLGCDITLDDIEKAKKEFFKRGGKVTKMKQAFAASDELFDESVEESYIVSSYVNNLAGVRI